MEMFVLAAYSGEGVVVPCYTYHRQPDLHFIVGTQRQSMAKGKVGG